MKFYAPNELPKNHSVPGSTVVPVLPYPDVREAVEWLTRVFGFAERLRIAEHRSQMNAGDGAIIVAEYIDRDQRPQRGAQYACHQIMVRVPDVNAHHQHVLDCGGEVLSEPTDYPYGERQYVVRDIGGHRWIFSETLRDSLPSEWGDENVQLLIP
ncbi:MAG: VOC family protein [Armatimonadetes bacterium]|nr:VOC family protein [Armatimonadota bacterium]